jgi:hypothetical protein
VDLAKRRSGVLFAGVLLGGLVLGGCDDNIEVIRDPDIHIAKGMTWAWRPVGNPAQTGRPVVSRDVIANPAPAPPPAPQHLESNRDWNTEANRNQLKEAIEHALKAKGLVQVNDPAAADFLVDSRTCASAKGPSWSIWHCAIQKNWRTVQSAKNP